MLARGPHASLWLNAARRYSYPALESDLDCDVAVVGGGITGLTTALLLQREGKSVVLVEGDQVASGTSGGTSAHVTEVLDIPYTQLLSRFGREGAEAWVRAAREGLTRIARFVDELKISCDFHRTSGYRFCESKEDVAGLEEDADTARRLGLTCFMTRSTPLPFPVQSAVVFENQAAFHPVRYLEGLGSAFVGEGGRLFEKTRVTSVEEEGGRVRLETPHGAIRAGKTVLATHTPVGKNVVHTELRPYRSYLVAARLQNDSPSGLFWDTADPYHYLRGCRAPEGTLLLAGGGDHPTGREEDPGSRWSELEHYLRERFHVSGILYRWSAQLYEPADGIPYIGKSALSDGIFIATGYSGVGLVQGTAAGLILAAALNGRKHPAADVCDPGRFKPLASAKNVIESNAAALGALVGDRLGSAEADSLRDVALGQGKITEIEGEKLAVYRDPRGEVHAFSPKCRHLGCFVRWNSAELTWDCPCHGGRYAPTGELLEGPPLEGLERRVIPRVRQEHEA